jgi:alkanesulfonate monooxygenase
VVDSLLDDYQAGCTTFILRGFNPLKDAIDYGKELIPLLRKGVLKIG